MEEKKKTNEKEVAMVECPFCNKPIEAPAKADVIFECPHCHKELITYENIIRKSKFPQNPKRSVRFSGKRTKRSVQKRKARNTQKAETKVL